MQVGFPRAPAWPTWQHNYRYGTLMILPPSNLASALDPIRARLDPVSAATIGAHAALTPPFATAPTSPETRRRVLTAIRGVASMRLQLDRPTQFSGSSVLYLPVVPAEALGTLREVLLAIGLFRLDLPHTTRFRPTSDAVRVRIGAHGP